MPKQAFKRWHAFNLKLVTVELTCIRKICQNMQQNIALKMICNVGIYCEWSFHAYMHYMYDLLLNGFKCIWLIK